MKRVFNITIIMFLVVAVVYGNVSPISNAQLTHLSNHETLNGVVMKGVYVNVKQNNDRVPLAPPNYIDNSIKMISQAGFNHVRFLFYWEAYERDPESFIKEIESVANVADKWGIKVIYDNHQWHTSSWLEKQGTGFPWSLFENNFKYIREGGGNVQHPIAKLFWNDWWNRAVKDNQGRDGWTLMADFLKKIVNVVDNHASTVGYEILSEPHVDTVDQWSKIGKFNTFMAGELRNATQKTIAYSMNVPVDFNSPINITPENLAKMAPSNKGNVVFKISVYGVPNRDAYQKERFDTFLQTRNLTGVPLYIGEWNNVVRTPAGGVFTINPNASQLTEDDAAKILDEFKKANLWGTAFWKWDYKSADTASFNLVLDSNGVLSPTKYFDILKNAVATIYGNGKNNTSTNN